jgi:hypothetical protein
MKQIHRGNRNRRKTVTGLRGHERRHHAAPPSVLYDDGGDTALEVRRCRFIAMGIPAGGRPGSEMGALPVVADRGLVEPDGTLGKPLPDLRVVAL